MVLELILRNMHPPPGARAGAEGGKALSCENNDNHFPSRKSCGPRDVPAQPEEALCRLTSYIPGSLLSLRLWKRKQRPRISIKSMDPDLENSAFLPQQGRSSHGSVSDTGTVNADIEELTN